MLDIKFSLVGLLFILTLCAFSCEKEKEVFFELDVVAEDSPYDNSFYLLQFTLNTYYDSEYKRIQTGEAHQFKLVSYVYPIISIVDGSCYGRYFDPSLKEELKLSGRPYMDLLELKFPEAQKNNVLFVDFNTSGCDTDLSYFAERINTDSGPFIYPVKPDTLNHLIVQMDGEILFNQDVYVGTDKVVLEIK